MMRCLVLAGFSLFSSSLLAGGNVALHVKVNGLSVHEKASNHPGYQAFEVTGEIEQSDAAVDNMPATLPQNVVILFKANQDSHKFLVSFCEKYAAQAMASGKSLRIDLFMDNPNDLPAMIEGGMADMRFNAFVVPVDGQRATVSCRFDL